MECSLCAYSVGSGAPRVAYSLPTPEPAPPGATPLPEPRFIVGSDPECSLPIAEHGWFPQHFALTWKEKKAMWEIENLSPFPARLEGRDLLPGQSVPLLFWETTIFAGEARLDFRRVPDRPRFGAAPVSYLPLTHVPLQVGRGEKGKDGSQGARLMLDPDVRTISASQFEIRPQGGDYIVKNLNANANGRTIVNGDQNFDERKLVLGDCIQIPNCDYYTFRFTGSGLRHLGQAGSLQGLGLTVEVKHGRILHPVSLELHPGEFLGIIGGSGQGKSTLMNALCGIVPATSGQVFVSGQRLRNPRDVARAGIGYVPQDDIVHRELIVEDALSYAARLRLRITPAQLRDLLRTTMEALRLTEHRHKRVEQLSGGQRKRVSIATELLVNPDFLFLDEPTSGLDPQTERALMGELAALAASKRIGVACTTHVLQNCHIMTALLFISRGRMIFCGKPVEALEFFLSGKPGEVDPEASTEVSDAHSSATGSTIGLSRRGAFTEADLPEKIAQIYEAAQDTTRPAPEQDRVAESWEQKYQTSGFRRPLPEAEKPVAAENTQPPAKVSALASLGLLIGRQWKIFVAAKLNGLFIVAQAVVIALLIAWASDNIVLQMFLSVIATLWFGCSNGAQQIVSELAIFRRERLAGLDIHAYLASKFVFWSAITSLQALAVFFVVLVTSPFFHRPSAPDLEEARPDFTGTVPDKATREFRSAFFDKPWSSLAAGDDTHEGEAAPPSAPDTPPAKKSRDDDFAIVGLEVDENNKRLPVEPSRQSRRIYLNPTGLRVTSFEYRLMEKLAGFFHTRENLLDSLALYPVMVADESAANVARLGTLRLSWKMFMANVVGLRLAALLGAAVVGVSLGTMISALANTPTQAVMWVPLILIPQILFGSFVVIVPEMSNSVVAFSRLLPSFNHQRTVDVGLTYGRAVPRMTNKTKIPAFLESPPDEKEKVDWEGQQTSYDRISAINKSWQNLIVFRDRLGAREKVAKQGAASGTQEETAFVDSIEERRDVALHKGTRFLELGPARMSALVLLAWVVGCYGAAWGALTMRQTGR
jgi:ABC-type multidrug transport system ATPase subunit